MASTGELVVQETRALSADITGSVLTGPQLKFIANTDFVPKSMRGNLPAIAACVATGRALGIPDMTALRSIHIIDGKATFSAELMVQLVRQRGHSITFVASGEACTVHGRRADNGDEGEFTWTLAMAENAGLLKKDNWKKYPESMLWARAVSQLCRMLFADCFAGASYTPEELGYGDVTADELMDAEPAIVGTPAWADAAAQPSIGEGYAAPESVDKGGSGQQDESAVHPAVAATAAGSSPDPEPDPEPEPQQAVIDWDAAAETAIPAGQTYAGQTLAQVAQTADGRDWLAWALRNESKLGTDFCAQLGIFIEHALANPVVPEAA